MEFKNLLTLPALLGFLAFALFSFAEATTFNIHYDNTLGNSPAPVEVHNVHCVVSGTITIPKHKVGDFALHDGYCIFSAENANIYVHNEKACYLSLSNIDDTDAYVTSYNDFDCQIVRGGNDVATGLSLKTPY